MKNKKEFFIIFILLLIQIIVYKIGELFAYRAHLMIPTFDNYIPYIKWFIYIYLFWNIMLIIIPYIISIYNKEKYYKYIGAALISLFISLLVFIFFPTIMERIIISDNDFTSKVVAFSYAISTPSKCIPSLHVVFSTLFILPLIKDKKIPKAAKISIYVLAVGVIFSTLFVKQHYVYDVLTGLLVALFSWFICNKFKIYSKLQKIIEKR